MRALAIALTGFVGWWWTEIDGILGQAYLTNGQVALGGDVVLGGIALGLQIFVGLLMFMGAFPPERPRRLRRGVMAVRR